MKIPLLILITLAVFSCKNKKENEHWTYGGETGPEHWIEIEKESDCDGKRQSPINIIDVNVIDDTLLLPVDVHYSSSVKIHEILNNGHSIQYNFEKTKTPELTV